jgi:hypothetical protein
MLEVWVHGELDNVNVVAMELAKPERKGQCVVLAWYGSNGKIFPFNKFLRWCACGLDKMLRRGLSP